MGSTDGTSRHNQGNLSPTWPVARHLNHYPSTLPNKHPNCQKKPLWVPMRQCQSYAGQKPPLLLLSHLHPPPSYLSHSCTWYAIHCAARSHSAPSYTLATPMAQAVYRTTFHTISCDLRTMRPTFFLKPSLSSRHCFAASTLAGDSSLGDDSMEMMEIMMVSTVCTGDQRSDAVS